MEITIHFYFAIQKLAYITIFQNKNLHILLFSETKKWAYLTIFQNYFAILRFCETKLSISIL